MSFLAAGETAAVTTKARIFRSRLLGREDYLRFLECGTVGEIASLLARTEGYGDYFRDRSPESMHRGKVEWIITFLPLLEALPFHHYLRGTREALLRFWEERFDADMIKKVLRIIATGRGNRELLKRRAEFIPMTLVDGERLVAAATYRDVLAALDGSPVRRSLEEPLRRLERGDGNLFRIKIVLDNFFFTRFLETAARLPAAERRGVFRIFGTRADLINMYWIYRARRFFSMSPEEAMGVTLSVRHKLNFETLSSFAFAPDVPAMIGLFKATPYGAAFAGLGGGRVAVDEMRLEHNLYRILWRAAAKCFATGEMGVHMVLAYLTLKELEVKDLFSIIEDVRYQYDKGTIRRFFINPVEEPSQETERSEAEWLSSR